jgi:hypothetical protein
MKPGQPANNASGKYSSITPELHTREQKELSLPVDTHLPWKGLAMHTHVLT